MNKLSRKFIIGITVVLCFFCLCTILFNSVFLDKYYLYQKRKELSVVCGELDEKILNGTEAEKAISQTEETNKVIVVKIEEFRKKIMISSMSIFGLNFRKMSLDFKNTGYGIRIMKKY